MNSPQIPWLVPDIPQVPEEVSAFFMDYPILSRALYQRGFSSAESLKPFLFPETYTPTNPLDFPGVPAAVSLLHQAMEKQQTIGVWGDFDVDGQTATAILVDTLRKLGAIVVYHLPIRGKESHGITVPFLKEFLSSGVNLLLTCDTGVTAHEAVAYARQHGITVIITDHHTLEEVLPEADSIVHPHLLPLEHPARTLCGAGAACMLAAALLNDLSFTGRAAEILDLTALGTIADLAILTGDNRYFVQRGLQRIRKHPLPLLEAIFELTDTNPAMINEEHISFQVAPRLNSLGRLGDANPVVEMLLSNNHAECRLFINQIEAMNTKRKYMTEQVFQAARAQIESNKDIKQQPVIIVSSPEWPGGIVGIVASRITETYNKPALVISTPVGESARGSARSIEGLDITACLNAARELLLTHGGHPMAAGFSLSQENLEAFKFAMARTVEKAVIAAPPPQGIRIDGFITLPEITLDLVEALEQLGPFGPGNPSLTFACQDLSIIKKTCLGRAGEHIQLILSDTSGNTMPAIRWQAALLDMPEGYFDLAFTLRKSDYKGIIEPRITWQYTRPSVNSLLASDVLPPVEVMDFRTNFSAGKDWLDRQAHVSKLIFSEGLAQKILPGFGRLQLHPAEILVFAGSPPDRDTLSKVIETVSPKTIAFLGLKSAFEEAPELMKQLIGLIHYAQKHKASGIQLDELLQATAQSEAVLLSAIEWINHQGEITLQKVTNRVYHVVEGGSYNRAASLNAQSQLKELLCEAKAFRAYYLRVDVGTLVAGINRKIKKE